MQFQSAEDAAALAATCCLAVSVLALRTEDNKQGFVKKESGGLSALLAALRAHSGDVNVVAAASLALKNVTTFDDLRKDFAGAYGVCSSLLMFAVWRLFVVLCVVILHMLSDVVCLLSYPSEIRHTCSFYRRGTSSGGNRFRGRTTQSLQASLLHSVSKEYCCL